MAKIKKIPQRQCAGCQQVKNKKDMIRVLHTADGEFIIDSTGKKSGRGAYICPDIECLNKAIKNKGLERSFKQAVPKEIYESLQRELTNIEK